MRHQDVLFPGIHEIAAVLKHATEHHNRIISVCPYYQQEGQFAPTGYIVVIEHQEHGHDRDRDQASGD